MTRISEKYALKQAQREAKEKMLVDVRKAQEEMWSNAVSVCIYPVNFPDQPMSEWSWDATIIVPNHQWRGSDEDGNFTVFREGSACFDSLESAFQWAYKWLNGRGYDVSNIEFDMKATAHDGIIRNSDLEKVREARNGA